MKTSGRLGAILSDLIGSILSQRRLGQDYPSRDTSGDNLTQSVDGGIGVVGQQRGALLARGSTVKQKKPNDE